MRRGAAAGVIVGCLLLGLVSGYGARAALTDDPVTPARQRPMAASGPRVPVNLALQIEPDPTTPPPLDTSFQTRRETLGAPPFVYAFPVPKTWLRHDIGAGEARFALPGDPTNTYYARVELVAGQTRTPLQSVQDRISGLHEDTRISQIAVLSQTTDSLEVSFVLDHHLKVSIIRWVSPGGGQYAEVEIAATGRMADRHGLQTLVEQMSTRVTRLD